MPDWDFQLIIAVFIVVLALGYGITRFLHQFGSEHEWRLEMPVKCVKCGVVVAKVHRVEMISPWCTVNNEVHCHDCLDDTVKEGIMA